MKIGIIFAIEEELNAFKDLIKVNKEYTIFTYTKVGEEEYTLYGFKSKEEKEFERQLAELKDEEEELKGQVTKLQDPDYIARYAREKYLYSKDGEIIIRIPE